MKNTVLVTGATGNVGSEVARSLKSTVTDIRAAITNVKDVDRVEKGIRTVLLDFENPATFATALTDINKVFLIRPPQMGDPKQLYPFIDACKAADVKHIVFLSLLGVQHNPLAPHGYIEKHIIKSGIPYTLLRPSFFMQNLSTTHLQDIVKHNEIFVPAGKGKTSFIDVRDIASVAAKILSEAGPTNNAYELTGAEALNYYEVSDILSQVTGRKINYTNPPSGVFGKRMLSEGFPKAFVTVMKGIYLVAKLRLAGKVTDDFETIMGRQPITFLQFAKDNRNKF